jgi:AraC-like DNA-binding protein
LQAPTLDRPILLGSTWSEQINSLDGLESLLSPLYRIEDLEPIRPGHQPRAALTFEAAAVVLGEIAITSVLGMPLTLAVQPLRPLCMVALPSIGWGQYQMDGHRVENVTGESIAFLPAVGWRLINDNTGGTAVQFAEDALVQRILAISGNTISDQALTALLAVPFVVRTDGPQVNTRYRQLLAALSMVDNLHRSATGGPDPMLRLDDLILRCVALMLHPQLTTIEGQQRQFCQHDLQQCVSELMEWMRANLHRPISLTEVEQLSHYGRRAIQMGFKQRVGCGPMQWLRLQRLEHALCRLQSANGTTSVTQVARACGYINLTSFSRDFRKRFGLSAREVLIETRSRHNLYNGGGSIQDASSS